MQESLQLLEEIQGLACVLKNKNKPVSLQRILNMTDSEKEILIKELDGYEEIFKRDNELQRRTLIQPYLQDKLKALREFKIAKNSKDKLKAKKDIDSYNKEITWLEKLKMPTKYQNFMGYSIIKERIDLVKKCPTIKKNKDLTFPVFGTVRSENLNACAISRKNGDPILILESGLTSFVLLMYKIVVSCFGFRIKDSFYHFDFRPETIQKLAKDPFLHKKFEEIIIAYIIKGNIKSVKDFSIKETHRSMVSRLIVPTEVFIVGHEFGHLIDNHYKDSTKHEKLKFAVESDVDILKPSWKSEFIADFFGLKILLETLTAEGYDIPSAYWGVEFFFSLTDVVTQAFKLYKTGDVATKSKYYSHPPNAFRVHHLRSVLTKQFSEYICKETEQMVSVIPLIVSIFWNDEIKKKILEMRDEKCA